MRHSCVFVFSIQNYVRFTFFLSQIINWLNESNGGGSAERCEAIKKIQELVVHSDVDLLAEFLENLLAFSHDPVQEVRRAVVGFIEEISLVD